MADEILSVLQYQHAEHAQQRDVSLDPENIAMHEHKMDEIVVIAYKLGIQPSCFNRGHQLQTTLH